MKINLILIASFILFPTVAVERTFAQNHGGRFINTFDRVKPAPFGFAPDVPLPTAYLP